MANKKTYAERNKTLVLDFEPSTLKAFRGVLFSKGLKPRQFINYIAELASMNDENILNLMDECKESLLVNKVNKNDFDDLSANELYDLLESENFEFQEEE